MACASMIILREVVLSLDYLLFSSTIAVQSKEATGREVSAISSLSRNTRQRCQPKLGYKKAEMAENSQIAGVVDTINTNNLLCRTWESRGLNSAILVVNGRLIATLKFKAEIPAFLSPALAFV